MTFPLMRPGSAAAGGSLVTPATPSGVACRRWAISLLALAIGAAPWCHLVVMRGLNPAPLHHQLWLAVLLACGKPLQNIAYMEGLGHVADIIRVWGWACLVCIIKTSFQKASQPKKHCF